VHTVFRESRHNAERRVEAEIERIYAAGIWAATGAADKARQVELGSLHESALSVRHLKRTKNAGDPEAKSHHETATSSPSLAAS